MRGRVLAGALAMLAFVALALLVVTDFAALVHLDTAIHDRARGFSAAHPGWLSAFRLVTHLGDIGTLVVVDCLVAGAFWWRGRRRAAGFVAIATVSTWLTTTVVKELVARPRPADRLWRVEDFSFPSGHSSNSAATAIVVTVLCLTLLRWRGRRWLVGAAVAGALAIAATRVASGVHWPSDVVAGWLLAITCAAVAAVPCPPDQEPVPAGSADTSR